ncbi:dipeptidase [Ferrovibrio terrae]|uniref:dipeptidase n=1 Tax=Ferrovibrio terrae TaxID=2594003 RepID=UPI0031382481
MRNDAMIFDGLQCGHFDRAVFESLLKGTVRCVTVTLGFWENAVESMDSIARWREMARANADIVSIAQNAADIDRAVAEGKLALLLGFQNAMLFEGRIAFVELFADMGVRVVQLTYNNQNDLGGSCYEEHDSGLARYGKEVIREMNRTGILVDLSHVGNRTTLDAVKFSQKPVAISHANADSLYPHKRNKTDDVLKALKDNGGVIGCATYRNIAGDHYCASVDNWCDMVARTVEIAGIDHVGIGTDRSHNTTQKDLDWMRTGRWTRGIDYGAGSAARPGKAPPADWFRDVQNIGEITDGLRRKGFNAEEVAKITHGNWRRVYEASLA